MSGTIRSAELIAAKALADPDVIYGLKTNPTQTLKNPQPEVISQFLPADPKISNAIWVIVVISFDPVMVGAAYAPGSGVTTKLEARAVYATKSDTTVLTVLLRSWQGCDYQVL
ncbi:MAG: hypothetical protein ACLQBD_29510 [Syntrophobacteraceae bacterium]